MITTSDVSYIVAVGGLLYAMQRQQMGENSKIAVLFASLFWIAVRVANIGSWSSLMYHVALIHAVFLALALSAVVRLYRTWDIRWFIAMVCCLVALSIPLARSTYHQCIDDKIQPLLSDVDPALDGDSEPICLAAELASTFRQECIVSTRNTNPIAEYISELFDAGRGVDQGNKKFGLFRQKYPCIEILHKSTHSNFSVNLFAVVITIISVVVTIVGFATIPTTTEVKDA